MFQHTKLDLVGRQPVEILLPERFRHNHVAHRSGYIDQPRTRRMGEELELYGLRSDGSEFPVEISLSPLQTEHGGMVMSAIRDTSIRKKAEQKFRGLLESAPDAIVIVDQKGIIVLINSQAEKIFGICPRSGTARTSDRDADTRAIPSPPSRPQERFSLPIRASARWGTAAELYGLRKDGTEFPVEISLSPLETEDGTLVSSAIRDITDRKRAEAKFRSASSKRPRTLSLVSIGKARSFSSILQRKGSSATAAPR